MIPARWKSRPTRLHYSQISDAGQKTLAPLGRVKYQAAVYLSEIKTMLVLRQQRSLGEAALNGPPLVTLTGFVAQPGCLDRSQEPSWLSYRRQRVSLTFSNPASEYLAVSGSRVGRSSTWPGYRLCHARVNWRSRLQMITITFR